MDTSISGRSGVQTLEPLLGFRVLLDELDSVGDEPVTQTSDLVARARVVSEVWEAGRSFDRARFAEGEGETIGVGMITTPSG
jgi:hypothetical protein